MNNEERPKQVTVKLPKPSISGEDHERILSSKDAEIQQLKHSGWEEISKLNKEIQQLKESLHHEELKREAIEGHVDACHEEIEQLKEEVLAHQAMIKRLTTATLKDYITLYEEKESFEKLWKEQVLEKLKLESMLAKACEIGKALKESQSTTTREQIGEAWVSCEERLPELDERGQSKYVLAYIDNPYFKEHHLWVSFCQKSEWGVYWQGIEPNVHHGTDGPNVTHWRPLPDAP